MSGQPTRLDVAAATNHGAGLQIDEDGSWDVPAAGCLIEVHVDALQLQVRITVVPARWVNAVLVGNDLEMRGDVCLVMCEQDNDV